MAINTKAKRRGAAGAGLLPGAYLPLPDHAVDAEDRRQLAGFYPRAPISTYVVGTKLQDAATADGNGVTIDVSNHPAVLVEVAGLTSGVIYWEGAGNSGLIRATSAIEAATHLPAVTAVRDGLYIVNCLDTLRARIADYVSGTITITVRESLSYPDANLLALSTIQSAQILSDDDHPISVRQAHLTAVNDIVTAIISTSALPTGAATEATLAALKALVPTALGGAGGMKVEIVAGESSSAVLTAGEAHVGEVGMRYAKPSANFTRPSDTNVYALGDLIANSVTAASVTPMQWSVARVAAGSGVIKRVRMKKSGTSIANASFRLHLYNSDPSLSTGIANGDNGVWLTNYSGYIGAMDAVFEKVFSDASAGNGLPLTGPEITFALASGQVIFGLLESRAAYVPISGEVFTLDLEVAQS